MREITKRWLICGAESGHKAQASILGKFRVGFTLKERIEHRVEENSEENNYSKESIVRSEKRNHAYMKERCLVDRELVEHIVNWFPYQLEKNT
mgnify:CR=1 FL=1